MFYRKIISSINAADLRNLTPFPPDSTITEISVPATREKSEKTARLFLLECPTFIFDGIRDSVRLSVIDILPQLHCWKFTYSFDCRQPGYGNRKGHRLLPFLAEHRIAITVKNGTISEAIIDDIWDELHQEML